MKGVCPKCKGKGTRPRTKEEDGTEADAETHWAVARSEKPCERCGGGGVAVLTHEEVQAASP